jgi:hypothetical protein
MSSKMLNTNSKISVKKSSLPALLKRQHDLILRYVVLPKFRRQQFSGGKQYYPKANPNIIIKYSNSFRVVSRMKGAALALHKTQFIKKPKNPI